MHVEKWNRAIKFLADRGHKTVPSDGDHVIVDERSYLFGDVHELPERWYPHDWIKSENAYLAALLGEPKPPSRTVNLR